MNPDKGIQLFNEGNFFEAHKAWETEWRNADDSPEKHFLQGMIMVSAALYHYVKKESAGTSKLLERALDVLTSNREAAIGMDRAWTEKIFCPRSARSTRTLNPARKCPVRISRR